MTRLTAGNHWRDAQPDLIGYLPVRKAALLGVQTAAAAMC